MQCSKDASSHLWQECDSGVCVDPEGVRNLEKLNKFEQLDFTPFDPRCSRTEAKLRASDGSIFSVSKVGLSVFSANTHEVADCS